MPRKNEANIANIPLSEEENTQVQPLLADYHLLAQQLRTTTKQAEAEVALAGITALSEVAQMALLSMLTKEHNTDAADILAAINAFSSHKEVRKEARRSLIRLETAKVHPQWMPPIAQASAIQVNIFNPPRFWKGAVTQTREQGEVQLMLLWEQGYDYSEVRIVGLLLDFWQEGVKDTFTEVVSRRTAENRINEMRHKLPEVTTLDCTLAEEKRLLEEALSVNAWHGTTPHKDYRNNLPIINQLILQANDSGADSGRTFINPELTDQEVVINFLGAWSLGDYGLAYDLLTHESIIRDRLPRVEWIERHRAWYKEATPMRLELGFVREREASQSLLWVPTSNIRSRSAGRKEIELGWSLELTDTPLGGTLREVPMGTAINKETRRHWFWTSYTMVQEQQVWRIQSINDEGASIQGLAVGELQKRIQEYEAAIDAKLQQGDDSEASINETLQELGWRFTVLLHYYDALIARLPLDRKVCEDAYDRAVTVGNPERMIVYLERLIQRFPDNRAELLRKLGSTFAGLAYQYEQRAPDAPTVTERKNFALTKAEEALREAISIQDDAVGHMLLGELLLSEGRNDEAEAELLRAKDSTMTPQEEAAVEVGLGNIAMRRERIDEALPHYQRVAHLQPNYPGIWFNTGFAQRLLGQMTEAETSYQHAIEIEPNDIRPYSELTAIYMNRSDKQKARQIMEQGIRTNPDSAHLHALFASVLVEIGDMRAAQRELQQAEAIDPTLEIVQRVRQHLNEAKKK